MKESLKKILLGKFLINEGSIKNWSYIFFLFTICLIMIYSSHSVDSKIIKIGDLKNEISVLQSRFINKRKEVMKLKMESNVSLVMIDRSIKSSSTPPKKFYNLFQNPKTPIHQLLNKAYIKIVFDLFPSVNNYFFWWSTRTCNASVNHYK